MVCGLQYHRPREKHENINLIEKLVSKKPVTSSKHNVFSPFFLCCCSAIRNARGWRQQRGKNGQWVSIPQIVRNIWKYQFNWNMVSENLYQTINSRHNLMVLFAAPLVIVRCERLVAAAGWYPVCGRCYDCSRVHPKCNNLIEKCKHVTSMFFMVYDCALWECGWGREWIPYLG